MHSSSTGALCHTSLYMDGCFFLSIEYKNLIPIYTSCCVKGCSILYGKVYSLKSNGLNMPFKVNEAMASMIRLILCSMSLFTLLYPLLEDEEDGQLSHSNILQETLYEQADTECSVCRDPIEMGTTIPKLACNHVFHMHCMQSWVQRNPSCPLCRAPVRHQPPPTPPVHHAPYMWTLPHDDMDYLFE